MPVEQSIIIGIHGLARKPQKSTLTKWWKAAICEGLNYNIQKKKNITPSQLDFSMVYWNDLMGKNRCLTPKQLEQPENKYQRARKGKIQAYKPRFIEKAITEIWIGTRDLAGDLASVIIKFTQNRLSETVMKQGLNDLYRYYNDKTLRSALQNNLIDELLWHKEKRIMLISHSMGTIIAYDVLRKLVGNKKLMIDHFVTMGSPLGLPFITERIQNGKRGKPIVPANIKAWTNFADMRDPVCADPRLIDDYRKNRNGLEIVDKLVLNDWPHGGISHKSYGYLRTPEVSKAIGTFIY